jgi:hypothetical protein
LTFLLLAFLTGAWAVAQAPVEQRAAPDSSACHVFIDHQFIWTLEVTRTAGGNPAPILNIITFMEGQWDLRPIQIHLVNEQKREAEIEKFSIDTGIIEDPYYLRYLKVQGDSFIGLDLLGEFDGFETLRQVSIELGDNRFLLEAVDCLEFERIAQQINQINYDSPDIRQDYEVLGIPLRGRREARRRFY